MRVCTCSNCRAVFTLVGKANPTHCPKCGAKFDNVIDDTGAPPFPPVGGNPTPLPPALSPPANPGGNDPGLNDMTPPAVGGAPRFDPPMYNPQPWPASTANSAKPSPGTAIGTGLAIAAGLGILVLGVVLIAGVIAFIVICRSVESASSGGSRYGRRRRRRYDA
jgi:hypothetical protein